MRLNGIADSLLGEVYVVVEQHDLVFPLRISTETKLAVKSEPDFHWVNNPSELHHLIEEALKKFQPMPQGLTASDIMAGRAQGVMSVEKVLEYYRCTWPAWAIKESCVHLAVVSDNPKNSNAFDTDALHSAWI
jgi:hypothetical protein